MLLSGTTVRLKLALCGDKSAGVDLGEVVLRYGERLCEEMRRLLIRLMCWRLYGKLEQLLAWKVEALCMSSPETVDERAALCVYRLVLVIKVADLYWNN